MRSALNYTVLDSGLGAHLSDAERTLFRRGQVIVSQGQRVNKGVYWLKSGRVKLSLLTSEGGERIMGFAGEGDSFGEASLLDDDGHLVMAQAVTDCLVYFFDQATIMRLLREDPGLSLALMRNLSRKLRYSIELIEEMSFLGVKERLAHVLARLARPAGGATLAAEDPALPVVTLSHQELAGLVGASRVMVTNALAELQREGAVGLGRRRLVIRDLGRLTGGEPASTPRRGSGASATDPPPRRRT